MIGMILVFALMVWIKIKTEMGAVSFTICLIIGVVLVAIYAAPFASDEEREHNRQESIREHRNDQQDAIDKSNEEAKKGNIEKALLWNSEAQKQGERIKELKRDSDQ